MRAHGIVIGIDAYAKPEWCLTGAVRDAAAFARWAVAAGGVDPKDLTLLLSPLPDADLKELLNGEAGAPDLLPLVKPATEKAIDDTFYSYKTGAGQDGNRLWLYYAGHGLAEAAQGPQAGPLVVPADVVDIDRYVSRPLALETFRSLMEDIPPKEQFFFVDACRDVLASKGNKMLTQQVVWDVRAVDDEQLSTQAVFLGTTAGQRAKEIRGHGLFGRALLTALRGLGPELRPVPTGPGQPSRRKLVFEELSKFVREAVERGLKDLPGATAADRKGIPYAKVNRLTGEILIREFPTDQLPLAKVGVRVEPAAARPQARIEFMYFSEDADDWVPRTKPAPLGPPIPEFANFEVRGGSHRVRVTARGFQEETVPLLVYEDKRYPVELRPQAPAPPHDGGLEGVAREATRTADIFVRCADRLAQVAVVDGRGQVKAEGRGQADALGMVPGAYLVSAQLTSADRVEKTIQARPGRNDVSLDVAAPPLSPVLAQGLAVHQIAVNGPYTHPSENFGDVANLRLGSILAYAAWAVRWPVWAGFHHLRGLEVDPLPGLLPPGSAVQVLVGDGASDRPGPLTGVAVQVEGAVGPIPLLLQPVKGFPAVQGSAVLPPGPARARVELPGFAPATFALSVLPGFVTVLVVTREADGDIDVQQHLNPVDPTVPVAPILGPPQRDDVRLVELAWRALETNDPLTAHEYDELLWGKRSNPLLGVIAGYRMARTDRADDFSGRLKTPGQPWKQDAPLWNLVRYFPGLPDVHILAGLYDRQDRDAHFQRAMDAGTPLVVKGFWSLVDWLAARAQVDGAPPPALRERVLPGLAWTAFADAGPPGPGEALRVVTSAGQNYASRAADDALRALSRSVGRLAFASPDESFISSCFLLAPRLAVCPIHCATAFAKERKDGSWTITKPMRVQFDPGDTGADRAVVRVLRALRPPPGTPLDGGSLDDETLSTCWPVLLELSAPAGAPPLLLAREAAAERRRVAVIGFPMFDARVPSPLFAQHFAGTAGERHVMLGVVVRPRGTTWTLDYDCYTTAGTSGAPLVDIQTGTVVGMHVAGNKLATERKLGISIALDRFVDHPGLSDPDAAVPAESPDGLSEPGASPARSRAPSSAARGRRSARAGARRAPRGGSRGPAR